MEGFFSAGISTNVLNQIKARENLFVKSVKTAEDLAVIHENTAWAVLRSGIDTPVSPEDRFRVVKDSETVETSNHLAIRSILGGELTSWDSGAVGYDRPGGVQTNREEYRGSAYRLTQQGHRPVAGITSVSVRTLDTWGMILEATVNLKVWSRDELEELDLVYFKPGFPALLEWGHTLYVRDDGSICKTPNLMISDEEFFNPGVNRNFDYLDKRIVEERKKTCNQEAVFGYITNFSYSLQNNGSYNCTLKILSKGTVIEGIRIKNGSIDSSGDEDPESQNDIPYAQKSKFHTLHRIFEWYYWNRSEDQKRVSVEAINHPGTGDLSVEDFKQFPSRGSVFGNFVVDGKEAIRTCFGGKIQLKTGVFGWGKTKNEKQEFATLKDASSEKFDSLDSFPVIVYPCTTGKRSTIRWNAEYYVTLRTLLYLINNLESENNSIGFNLWSTAKYVTVPGHNLSLNPYVAVLPSQGGGNRFGIKHGFVANPLEDDPCWSNVVQMELGTDPETGEAFSENNGAKILNIWVNFGQFIAELDKQLDEKTEMYSIFDALKSYLNRIQKALGNINAFQIVNNQFYGGSLFELVDTKCIYTKTLPGEIQVTGLGNTVRNLTIQSDISSEIANEMSIAAQAPKTYDESSISADESMVNWGENCRARWVTETGLDSSSDISTELVKREEDYNKDLEKWEKQVEKAYKLVGKAKAVRQDNAIESTAEERFGALQTTGERFKKADVRLAYKNNMSVDSNLQMGIVPIRVGFTMMGLGRLTVGTTFRISTNVLPRKYRNWAYIVTKIDHSISKSGWETTIGAQYYPIYYQMDGVGVPATQQDRNQQKDLQNSLDSGKATVTGGIVSQSDKVKSEIDACTSLFTAFTKKAGFDWGGTGDCAWFTAGWARAYLQGKNFLKSGIRTYKGRKGPACYAGGNANNLNANKGQGAEVYLSNIKALGYREVARKTNVSAAEICQYENKNAQVGDIVNYWNPNRVEGHTHFCVFRLGNITKWVSDFEQISPWSNSKGQNDTEKKWTMVLLRPTKQASSDWKSIR